jgi:hypothetical protein
MVQSFDGLVVVTDGKYRAVDTQLNIEGQAFGCGAASYCVGLSGADSGYLYLDGKFHNKAVIDPPIGLTLDFNQASCPELNVCFAVGENYVTIYGHGIVGEGSVIVETVGRVWSKTWYLKGTIAWSLSCVSRTLCFAASDHEILELHGNVWKVFEHVTLKKPDTWSSISCSSSTFCVAASDFGSTFVYDGHHWSAQAEIGAGFGGPEGVDLLSCWSTGNCLAGGVGGRVRVMLDGKWQPWIHSRALYGSGLQDLSCSRVGMCAIVNSDGQLYWRKFT